MNTDTVFKILAEANSLRFANGNPYPNGRMMCRKRVIVLASLSDLSDQSKEQLDGLKDTWDEYTANILQRYLPNQFVDDGMKKSSICICSREMKPEDDHQSYKNTHNGNVIVVCNPCAAFMQKNMDPDSSSSEDESDSSDETFNSSDISSSSSEDDFSSDSEEEDVQHHRVDSSTIATTDNDDSSLSEDSSASIDMPSSKPPDDTKTSEEECVNDVEVTTEQVEIVSIPPVETKSKWNPINWFW